MSTKNLLFAGGLVVGTAGVLNGSMFIAACDGEQLTSNCHDSIKEQHHVENREASSGRRVDVVAMVAAVGPSGGKTVSGSGNLFAGDVVMRADTGYYSATGYGATLST